MLNQRTICSRAFLTSFLGKLRLFVLYLSVFLVMTPYPFGINHAVYSQQKQGIAAPELRVNAKLPFNFAAIGDNGSGLKGQMMIAEQMIRFYKLVHYPLVLMLGDNIYPDGNVKALGAARFTDVYRPLLEDNVVFKPCLGNHDIVGGYTEDGLRFFGMPSSYYTYRIGKDLQFFAIDTMNFDTRQQQWLEDALAGSDAAWKIVYGHYPVFSSGMHGNSILLREKLHPLLVRYHVSLYLAGHDHDYERFSPIDGVVYMISGGGGASLRNFRRIRPASLVRYVSYEFLHFTFNGKTLLFETIDDHGRVIDTGEIKQQKTKPLAPAA